MPGQDRRAAASAGTRGPEHGGHAPAGPRGPCRALAPLQPSGQRPRGRQGLMATAGTTKGRGRKILRIPGMKILDTYIFREFLLSLVAVVAFCTLLLLIASSSRNCRQILDAQTSLGNMVPSSCAACRSRSCRRAHCQHAGGHVLGGRAGALQRDSGSDDERGSRDAHRGARCIWGHTVSAASFYFNETVVPPLEEKAAYYEQLMEGRRSGA